MKKTLFTATLQSFMPSFELSDISILQQMGYTVYCGASVSPESDRQLSELGVQSFDVPFTRSPFSFANIKAYKQLKALIAQYKFDVIHCHTPVGGMLTRLAARHARKNGTKVIYTAHGFHFYKGAPLINWLLYYPAEKLCAHFTDAIITINTEDYALAKAKLKAKNVYYIPGVGVDTGRFVPAHGMREEKRAELGISGEQLILFSIGELNKNKNHQVVIRALAAMSNTNVHYYIAGKGELDTYLAALASDLGVSDRVHLLGHRNDVAELLAAADVFCFPSFREGLSLSLMEAMSCGKPVICSKIRGNVDLIDDGLGGLLFNPKSSTDLASKIMSLIDNQPAVLDMCKYNLDKIRSFALPAIMSQMKNIYFEALK